MKILKAKSFKIILYSILVYIVATWGVNQVINPVVYVQNIIGQDKYEPVVETTEDTIIIQPTQDLKECPYVSFKMDCETQYKIEVQLEMLTATEEGESKKFFLENGVNVIKTDDPAVKEIRLTGKGIAEYAPEITKVIQAPYARVNLLKSLEICLAIIGIIVFWEGLQYIRTKYTV